MTTLLCTFKRYENVKMNETMLYHVTIGEIVEDYNAMYFALAKDFIIVRINVFR